MIRTIKASQRGFTLIELSVALAVIGVVVAGGLSMSTSMVDRNAYVQTGKQMDEVDKALAAFVAANNRLPCPATANTAITAASFGLENCGLATTPGTGTPPRPVIVGGLPVKTLGLRNRYAADEYGHRYTYAVTQAMTTTAGYEDASGLPANLGAVAIQDSTGATYVNDAAYAVVSHGDDGKGALRYETASANVACGTLANGQDAANCNGDATFREARFNRGSVPENVYDDTLRFARKEMVNMAADTASISRQQLWVANGTNIYNTNTGNVGVGIANPVEAKLQVYGNTFGQPAIKAVHDMNGIAVHGIGQGASPSFLAEFSDQNGAGYRADNLGWGGRLFEGIGDDSMNVGMFLEMSGADSTGIDIATSGNNAKGIVLSHTSTNGTGLEILVTQATSSGISVNHSNSGSSLTYSGRFRNASSNGVALYAENYNTLTGTGRTHGVFGLTQNRGGGSSGVRGEATASIGGYVHGVEGISYGSGGGSSGVQGRGNDHGVTGYGKRIGVYGTVSPVDYLTHVETISVPGGVIGGYFRSVTTSEDYGVYGFGGEYGVYAMNESSTGISAGHFINQSNSGTGVHGRSTALGGINYGVFGQAASASGYGIYCNATSNALGCGGNRAWTNTSDIRLKKHISVLDATRGLDAIRKLRPVTYEWKDEANKAGRMQIGFIAQEVEKVIPEVVGDGADQEITIHGKKEVVSKAKAMSYAELTAPIVRAIQQLADKFDALFSSVEKLIAQVSGHDARIKTLEAENAALKARLDALEAKLAK